MGESSSYATDLSLRKIKLERIEKNQKMSTLFSSILIQKQQYAREIQNLQSIQEIITPVQKKRHE